MKDKKYIFINPDGTEDVGLCLVIESPTGVEYGNQCGGHSNEERVLEGYLIPLGMLELEQELYDFFWEEFRGNCYEPDNEWTTERISKLETIIAKIPDWICSKGGEDKKESLALDRNRIDECTEAWIPVLSKYGRGVLMLKNSD
ncbi:MAG: DUF6210 family protein [Phycisphaerae bacterium]|jgi:hypothetical protein|nr:DUF6210 family protein [Phycisphaerae bacterium]